MVTEIRLPEVGEHIETATVVRVLVEPGQQIAKDQTIMELETEKATLEVPSTVAGRVKAVMVKAGETIKIGSVILTVEEGEGSEASPQPMPAEAPQPAIAPAPAPKPAPEPTLKLEEPPQEAVEEEVEEEVEAEIMPAAQAAPAPVVPPAPQDISQSAIRNPQSAISPVPAAPAVRRLAREIGVEITQVQGSGPGGRISEEDVKRHAREQAGRGALPAQASLPDFSRWGALERQPLPSIRRLTGEHVTRSWVTIPHVHQNDKADITELERMRVAHNAALPAGAPKLTVTVILTKLIAGLLGRHPRFNASIDPSSNELILKKYIHLGIAVNTERGLLVPVIRDVNQKSIRTLTEELAALSERARAGKLSPEEMQGGTFTISNLGGIGGTSFSPIINAPEVAILGVARSAEEIVPVAGQPAVRLMLPLTLGYDHRVIDGAEGASFLHEAALALASPFELLIEV